MAKKILFRTGLEADAGVLDAREPGFTSDSLRACIGDGTAAKFLTSETLISIATAAPAALAQMEHTRTSIICDTDTAAASIALDIQSGALVTPSICEVLALGSNTARYVNVTYRAGYVLPLPVGRSRRFIWNGAAWYLMGEEFYANTAAPSTWDKTTSAATGSPDTWDLSGVVPKGTRRITLRALISRAATAEFASANGYIWDYDDGAFNPDMVRQKGAIIPAGCKAATVSSQPMVAGGEFRTNIGASRKLYIATSDANWSMTTKFLGEIL